MPLAKEKTASVRSRLPLFSSINLTKALPTTTPSARGAILRACSGVEIPKPTATGRLLLSLILATSRLMFSILGLAVPVTPVTEM